MMNASVLYEVNVNKINLQVLFLVNNEVVYNTYQHVRSKRILYQMNLLNLQILTRLFMNAIFLWFLEILR